MTKDTLDKLRKVAAKQERLDFERDALMLKSRRDGDSMVDIARAAGLSRQHAYRVINATDWWIDMAMDALGRTKQNHAKLGDEYRARAFANLDAAKTWSEFLDLAEAQGEGYVKTK